MKSIPVDVTASILLTLCFKKGDSLLLSNMKGGSSVLSKDDSLVLSKTKGDSWMLSRGAGNGAGSGRFDKRKE